METMDLPTITDEVPEAVPAAGPSTAVDLKRVDLQAVALAQFGDWRADVAAARKNLSTLALDLTIPARIADAKTLRQRLINAPRAEARKVATALKSKLTGVSKAVGVEMDAAVAAYDALEPLITPQIDAAEERIENERIAKQRAEDERLQALIDTVDATMAKWRERCDADGMTSARVQAGMAALGELPMPAELADVSGHWAAALAATHTYMERRRLALAQAELEAEQVKVRAEAQRVADIQARIAEIQAAATGHEKANSVDLIEAHLIVSALDVSEAQYQEFTALAQATKAATLATIKGLIDAAVNREVDARLAAEAQAAEAQRLQDEEAARQRAEAPAANVATAAATEGKADNPEPGKLEAAQEFTEGQDSQQVLKAEPATADATDRDAPADTCPRGGAMGAWQPAAAGPAGGDPRDEFVALVMTAFDCKFPTHPKPSQEWWSKVRAAGLALQS